MGKNEELIKAFTASIEMEEEGREFYIKASKKTTNEFCKKAFESLADDEIRHIAAIKGYCENIAKKNKTPHLCAVMPRHKDIKNRLIFGKREADMLKKVPPETDELKAYEAAMGMENDSYNFYKKTLKYVDDPDTKDLYKFLLSEEEAHFELISSTYEYLKNPALWFAKEEKPIVEG